MCAEDGFRPVPRLIQSSIAVISSSILPPALRLPSFACQAVALAEAGGSSFVSLFFVFVLRISSRFGSMSFAASPRFRSSDRPNVGLDWARPSSSSTLIALIKLLLRLRSQVRIGVRAAGKTNQRATRKRKRSRKNFNLDQQTL